jgi:hypothetical protein
MKPVTYILGVLLVADPVLGQDCAANGACDTHERCPVWRAEGECIRSKVRAMVLPNVALTDKLHLDSNRFSCAGYT